MCQVLLADGTWNSSNLHAKIPQEMIKKLEYTGTLLTNAQDTLLWNETRTGKFTCQSTYKTLDKQIHIEVTRRCAGVNWKVLWKRKLTNKIKHFLWLAIQDKLLANSIGCKRQMSTNPFCVQCTGEP